MILKEGENFQDRVIEILEVVFLLGKKIRKKIREENNVDIYNFWQINVFQ